MDDESNAGVETDEEGSDLEGVEDDESVSSADSEDNTDWKAIAEKAQVEAANYKQALTQKRQLRKKPSSEEVEENDESEEDDNDRPLTRREFQELLETTVLPAVAGNKIDTILADKVKDPNKRNLVKLYYDTRIRQTGTSDEAIRSDIDAAIAIADSHKNRKLEGETKRAAGKDNTPPLNGSSADRGAPAQGHKFTADQVKTLTAQATRIGADPKAFIKKAWENAQKGKG